MDIDALLEAFQDFEKRGKKEICPTLEQFLCHVAKTGQPMIPWSQLKTYFLFKLDKVMEDFHASAPEERDSHNPNVEYIPFEEMKKRILKIVDGYNGIPFTIQRLCELLTDPKRNYSGTDKFLRGLEKNVMVVSYLHPTSEKNGTSTANRMNGVMFLGNSPVYSDSRNINGPGTPKTLNRPKLSSSSSLSTNGLQEYPPAEEDPGAIYTRAQPLYPEECELKYGIKNKHSVEDEECDGDKQEPKKLKISEKDDETQREANESSCHKGAENSSETPASEEDACVKESNSETSPDTSSKSDSQADSSTRSEPPEREEESSEAGTAINVPISVDQSEQGALSETHSAFEQDSAVCDSSNSDAEDLPSEKVSSSSNSPELSTEGGAETSDNAESALEPEEHN